MGHQETPVEDYFVARVIAVGGSTRKVVWKGRRGAPDRRAMHKKGRAWVEIKPDGVPLEDHQKREHKRMRAKGEIVVTVTGRTGVDRFIEDLMAGEYAAG